MVTVNPSILIAALSLIVACIVGISGITRNMKSDDKQEAAEMTTVIVKLENISSGISEIKTEMKNVKNDIQDLRDRLIIAEQSTKSAHHRLDAMVKKGEVS